MSRRHVPPPIAPPKGLTGMLEGYNYEPGVILDTSSFPEGMVLLNVYDVSDNELFQNINKVTTANNNILVGGVFHAGVEVYGKEWCYGITEYGRSGVCAVLPRTHPQHNYRCTVPLGATQLNDERVEELLERLSEEWPGHEYDLLHHNCISFCNAVLKELIPNGRVPGWVDRAMRTAGFIDLTSKKVAEDTQHAAEVMRSFSTDLQQKAMNMSADEALDLAQKNSELLVNKASEHINVLLEWGEGLKTSAQRGLEEQGLAQELPPEVTETAEVVRRKTQEFGDEIGEKAQALGASLWQWGQDLQTKSVWGLAEEATSNLQSSVRQVVEGTAESAPSSHSAKMPTKGLLDEDDDDLLAGEDGPLSEGRCDKGLIRSAEDRHLKQSLLAEDDDDDEDAIDLLGISAALKDGELQGYKQEPPPVVEAPADWSASSDSATKQEQAPAATNSSSGAEPVWDLLDTQGHVVYGSIKSEPAAAKAPKEADPLDDLDLLG